MNWRSHAGSGGQLRSPRADQRQCECKTCAFAAISMVYLLLCSTAKFSALLDWSAPGEPKCFVQFSALINTTAGKSTATTKRSSLIIQETLSGTASAF